MKIFEWIHCKLQRVDHYSQVYGNKDGDVSLALCGDEEEAAAGETDTEALLLHDMLNGILTIGTLSRHHCLMQQPCSDSEEECFVEGGGVAAAALWAVVAAREPLAESFRIKLSAEEERMMGVVKLHEVAAAAEKTLELPLLLDLKENRAERPRTTLADLLASNAEADSAGDQREKSLRRRRNRGRDHEAIADAKPPPPTLKSRALKSKKKKKKKKNHPTAMEGAKKAEQPSIADARASDVL